jgi:hypothetical protein
MKSGLYLKLGVGLVLGLLPVLAATQQTPTTTDSNPVPPATMEVDTNAPVDAPVTPVPSEKSVPTKVKLSIPASELVRLANSGVEQSVLLAYVTNSTSTFNLGAEEIIYLNDIGVPSAVVTAMIQHDQTLKGAMAATLAANTPAQTPPPMAEPPPAMPTEEPPPAEGQPEAPPPAEAPLTPPETTSDFYGTLAPYGSWVNVGGYGLCWQPTVVVVNPLWQPYCDGGHWVYTDCGWYWSSGYSWGWAPFHYGRWFCHARLGWCWAPDTVWGPSWVCWRHSNTCCGWAPLPPGCTYRAGVGLTFHGHPVQSGDDLGLNNRHYTFVAWNNLRDQHLQAHRLPRDQAARAFNHSEVANRFTTHNNMVVNQGIPATQVASATRAPLHPVALQTATAPSAPTSRMDHFDPNNRTLTVYRPVIHEPARPSGTVAQNTGIGTASGTSIEKAPWRPVSSPAQAQSPTGAQVHSGAHLTPPGLSAGQPVAQGGTPRVPAGSSFSSGAQTPIAPTMGQPAKPAVAQQNPTIISLKGPQSPSTAAAAASGQVWNPYTQNPTPWQNTRPASQQGFNAPAQTAMNVPQVPAQAQRSMPAYSGQYNQGYPAPNYPAPNYQAPNYSAPAEVPRYNSYPQSHAYSQSGGNTSYQGNRQSAPVYQAPPQQQYAAPAPSAPPARSSQPPQQASRGDNSVGGGNGRGR